MKNILRPFCRTPQSWIRIPVYLFGIVLAFFLFTGNLSLQTFSEVKNYVQFVVLDPFLSFLLLFFVLALVFLLGWSLVTAYRLVRSTQKGVALVSPDIFSRIREKLPQWKKQGIGLGSLFLLVVTSMILTSPTLIRIVSFLQISLRDMQLVSWDYAITHTFPFLALHSIAYPNWFSASVVFSYLNLTAMLFGFGVYLFFRNRPACEHFFAVFSINLILLFCVWVAVPALTPQSRFIDNIPRLPIRADIQSALAVFNPSAPVADFLKGLRTSSEGDAALPLSTFPSAHIAWAILIGYYAFRMERKVFYILIIPLLLSSFGTVFLAQHYFVDIPSSLLLTAFSIWLAEKYLIRPTASSAQPNS